MLRISICLARFYASHKRLFMRSVLLDVKLGSNHASHKLSLQKCKLRAHASHKRYLLGLIFGSNHASYKRMLRISVISWVKFLVQIMLRKLSVLSGFNYR
jgi:hypothetical protein